MVARCCPVLSSRWLGVIEGGHENGEHGAPVEHGFEDDRADGRAREICCLGEVSIESSVREHERAARRRGVTRQAIERALHRLSVHPRAGEEAALCNRLERAVDAEGEASSSRRRCEHRVERLDQHRASLLTGDRRAKA